jgi:hypothetical protein
MHGLRVPKKKTVSDRKPEELGWKQTSGARIPEPGALSPVP